MEAVPELLRRWPELHVDIAGTGPARDSLLTQARQLGLERTVSLPGRVTEQVKSDLLSRAWLTVAPSLGEGWGLTVLEANTALDAPDSPACARFPGCGCIQPWDNRGWLAPAPNRARRRPLARAGAASEREAAGGDPQSD